MRLRLVAVAHVLRDTLISIGDLQQLVTGAQIAQMKIADIACLTAHLLRATLPVFGIFNKACHIVPTIG